MFKIEIKKSWTGGWNVFARANIGKLWLAKFRYKEEAELFARSTEDRLLF